MQNTNDDGVSLGEQFQTFRKNANSPNKLPYWGPHKFQSTLCAAQYVYVPSASVPSQIAGAEPITWACSRIDNWQGRTELLRGNQQISWKATAMELQQHLTARTVESPMKCHKSKAKYRTRMLTFYSLPVTWCTTSLTFNKCTLCPHCIYVFCIYLRTNSDLCHLQLKLIGFYSRDEKCLQRGTDWVFK